VVAGRLGIGLANIITIFDPRMIVVGGLIQQIVEQGRHEVDRILSRQLTPSVRATVTICPPGLGQDSSLLGAAELGFDELFDTKLNLRALSSAAR